MINTKNWFQLRPMYSYIRKQSENEKFLKYLEIGGTFTLITLFLFLAILPTMSTISSLIGEIKSKEAYIKKVDTKIANIIKAQENYGQFQENYHLIDDSFPSFAKYHQGASNLATIFRDSSLGISQIDFNLNTEAVDKKSFLKSYQININGEGQYSSVMEMVKKIISNRRLVEVISLKLNQSNPDRSNQSSSGSIKVSLSSDLFFLPDNE